MAARVRAATPGERAAVLAVLDAAMLETDATDVAARIADETVLVAVEADRILGAIDVATDHVDAAAHDSAALARVEAVAVRPGRRGQGIGTTLVEAAAERWRPLVAAFDADVRPFYDGLGFDVETRPDGRCRGVLH